jgi:nucleoside-diphosphate kinase
MKAIWLLKIHLGLIKPDGVRKNVIGQVIARYEAAGLKVVAMRMLVLSRKEAEGFLRRSP